MQGFSLPKLFDRYDLLARIVPGLLTVLIPSAAVLIADPTFRPSGPLQWISSSIVTVAVLWLLANWARSRGRWAQERLKKKWGALPTEIILRHRDHTIEAPTKQRYHAALRTIAPDVIFPDREAEAADPAAADDAYRSGIRRLIENRRGPQYALILGDNIA